MLKNATDFSQVLGPIQSEKRKKRKRKEERVKGRRERQNKTHKKQEL